MSKFSHHSFFLIDRRTLGSANSPSHMWKPPSRSSSINSLASTYSQVTYPAALVYLRLKDLTLTWTIKNPPLPNQQALGDNEEGKVPLRGQNPLRKPHKQSHLPVAAKEAMI